MRVFVMLAWFGMVHASTTVAPCPMGANAGAKAMHSAHAGDVMEHSPTGHHHGAATTSEKSVDGHRTVPSDRSTLPNDCDCLSHCCAAPTIYETVATEVAVAITVELTTSPTRHTGSAVSAWVDFMLPYAIAPPLRAFA